MSSNQPESQNPAEVWLVDDDVTFLYEIAAVLRTAGYKPILIHDPRLVLKRLRCGAPAAIVLDLEMPEMNGLELLAALRQSSRGSGLPALLLTGAGNQQVLEAGFESGLDDYLEKPCRARELVLRIEAKLRHKAPEFWQHSFSDFLKRQGSTGSPEVENPELHALCIFVPELTFVDGDKPGRQFYLRSEIAHRCCDLLLQESPQLRLDQMIVFELNQEWLVVSLPFDIRTWMAAPAFHFLARAVDRLWQYWHLLFKEQLVLGESQKPAGTTMHPQRPAWYRLYSREIKSEISFGRDLALALELENNPPRFKLLEI